MEGQVLDSVTLPSGVERRVFSGRTGCCCLFWRSLLSKPPQCPETGSYRTQAGFEFFM